MAVEKLHNEVYNYDEDVLHVYAGDTTGTREGRFNYTLAYNKHRIITMEGYDLKSFFAFAGYPNTLWKPTSTLNRTDADVTLFFVLSNKVWYYSQSDDPIFSAHTPFNELYRSDYDIAALGCTDQHQICEPVDGTCTALTGFMLLMGEIRRIGLNEMQVSTAERILRELYYVNMDMAVSGRGSSALIASETVHEDAQSASIPPDQWIIETRNWFSVGLSRLQQAMVSYASGPTNLGTYGVIDRPAANDSTGQSLCRNQMVRDTTGEHQSFSLLGVILIVVLGGAIILSSFFLDTVVGCVQKWTRWGVEKRRQWTYDGKFILLKVAFEGSTRDLRWIHEGDTEIPVTEGAHQFSSPLASLQTTVFNLKSHRQHSHQSNEESNVLLKKKEEAYEMTEVV